MTCRSVLVVEDDEDIRSQVIQALEAEGYNVVSASNGAVALEKLKALSPDELPGCMILDLMMPIMDGKTLMDTIDREYKDRFGQIKVLVATAKGSPVNPSTIPQAIERIQKPFDLDELYSKLEEHCGKP